jgi:hypothetical protein
VLSLTQFGASRLQCVESEGQARGGKGAEDSSPSQQRQRYPLSLVPAALSATSAAPTDCFFLAHHTIVAWAQGLTDEDGARAATGVLCTTPIRSSDKPLTSHRDGGLLPSNTAGNKSTAVGILLCCKCFLSCVGRAISLSWPLRFSPSFMATHTCTNPSPPSTCTPLRLTLALRAIYSAPCAPKCLRMRVLALDFHSRPL